MSIAKARIIAAEDFRAATSRRPGPAAPSRAAHILRRELVQAQAQALQLQSEARKAAQETLDQAEAKAAAVLASAERDGREKAVADLAERTLLLALKESKLDERALGRSIELATLLAERLLEEALVMDASRVTALARSALGELRGARQIKLVCHPSDGEALAPLVEDLKSAGVTLELQLDEQQGRGSLQLHTEMGVLDGDLRTRLELLAGRLRGQGP